MATLKKKKGAATNDNYRNHDCPLYPYRHYNATCKKIQVTKQAPLNRGFRMEVNA